MTPSDTAVLTFDPLDLDAHLDLIHRWMQHPHVAPWWDLAGPIGPVHAYLVGQLALPHLRPWVVSAAGEPFGYVETYRPAQDPLAGHVAAAGLGLHLTEADRGWHVLVGPPAALGTGLARRLGRATLDRLFAEPGVTRVLCEPDAGNGRMIRYCEVLGHVELARLDLPDKRAVLLAASAPDRQDGPA